jgi:3-oxoadipate enol-lactonase
MPKLQVNGAELYFEDTRNGPETIVFAHGLLFSSRMFAAQVDHFKDRFRCVSFDFRGQGQSEVTRSGYDIETLTMDTIELLQQRGAFPCHFVGLSMGGFVGMRLALRFPKRMRSLILLSTSADREPTGKRIRYTVMALAARWLSKRLIANRVANILFGKGFQTDPARAAERDEWRRLLMANSRVGASRASRGVFARPAFNDEIAAIRVPTLVLVGEEDVATPPVEARRIHESIPDSKLLVLPGAGHSPTIETPEAVNRAMEEFLANLGRS